MIEENDRQGNLRDVSEGHRPFEYGEQPLSKKGYQPTSGNLDGSKPPQGGSGVPSGPISDTGGGTNQKGE